MNSDFDVVVVGSLNLDLVARTRRHPSPGETVSGSTFHEIPGGKGLNQAVAAARAGASVALVGSVGADDAGDRLREVVQREGIDDRWLEQQPSAPTGRALIVVSDTGENSIVVVSGANARTGWPTVEPPLGRVVVAQLEIPQASVSEAFTHARHRGAATLLNPAPAAELDHSLLEHCSILVPNEHELTSLGGVPALTRLGVRTVIVTRGAAGATIERADQPTLTIDAFTVDAVDTTGAGDAFCGNLAARIAAGDDTTAAARWAAAAGALATTTHGAVPSLPSHDDVGKLIDGSLHAAPKSDRH